MQLPIFIALIFLFVLSVLDVKTFHLKNGFIPAVLTTSFLILEFLFNLGSSVVEMGIFAALISMLLVDLDLFRGIADVKVFVALGMTTRTVVPFLIFAGIMLITTIIYQSIIKILIKKKKIKKLDEIPLIPAILVAYLGSILLGVI